MDGRKNSPKVVLDGLYPVRIEGRVWLYTSAFRLETKDDSSASPIGPMEVKVHLREGRRENLCEFCNDLWSDKIFIYTPAVALKSTPWTLTCVNYCVDHFQWRDPKEILEMIQ